MSVTQPDNHRMVGRSSVRPYVVRPPSKVASRLVDCLVVGLVALALLGVVAGLRAARTDRSAPIATAEVSSVPEPGTRPAEGGLPIGAAALVAGTTATVTSAGYQQTVGSQFVSRGYIVADLMLVDAAGGVQPYDSSHWSVQSPSGAVLRPARELLPPPVRRPWIEERLVVQTAFEVGTERGTLHLLYKPTNGPDRGAWQVDI